MPKASESSLASSAGELPRAAGSAGEDEPSLRPPALRPPALRPPALRPDGPVRPLRRDAARNHERILEAAAELFSERGLSASLNDIARHSGLGVGTIYRHFPDRDKLIETLFQNRAEKMIALVEEGLADPDPWHGLVTSLERILAMQASDRGMRQLVHGSAEMFERSTRLRQRLLPMGEELLRRAQSAGAVRSDVQSADLPVVQIMVGAVIDAGRDVSPEMWRRYLALLLRGISATPENLADLPGSAPQATDIDRMIVAAAPKGN